MSPYPLAPSWVDFYEIRAERDAANARADQAIRFAAQVEEECAQLTEALKRIEAIAPHQLGEPKAENCVLCIVDAALYPAIAHDLHIDRIEVVS